MSSLLYVTLKIRTTLRVRSCRASCSAHISRASTRVSPSGTWPKPHDSKLLLRFYSSWRRKGGRHGGESQGFETCFVNRPVTERPERGENRREVRRERNHQGMLFFWSRWNEKKTLRKDSSKQRARRLLSSDWVAKVTRRWNPGRFGRMRRGIRQFTDVRRNWFRGDRNYFFRKSRYSLHLYLSIHPSTHPSIHPSIYSRLFASFLSYFELFSISRRLVTRL